MPEFNIRSQRGSAATTPGRRAPSRRTNAVSAANRTKRSANTGDSDRAEEQPMTPTGVVRDGFVLDFISGTKEVKETAKELVRQRIARALFHEYGISVEDMAPDFPVRVGGRRRRTDLVVFGAGKSHAIENIQRIVICRPEPKQSKRGAVKMRDYEQAAQDIDEVKPFFEEIDTCKYALWTNGLEFFFLAQEGDEDSRLTAEPIGDWPPADESIGERNVLSLARARAPRRPGDAPYGVSPLPQLHPRQ